MTPREIHLLDARRRARLIRSARSPVMHEALVRRVLFDLREALRREPPPKEPTQ